MAAWFAQGSQAMRTGWFRQVHVKIEASRLLRLLPGNRRRLVEHRVALENAVRGSLQAFGLKAGTVGEAGFAARVRELLAGRPDLLELVEPMLRVRATLRTQIQALDRRVRRLARATAAVARKLAGILPRLWVDGTTFRHAAKPA
jgi:transposase